MAQGGSRWFGARDLVEMWSNIRMVVLVAISAAVYAAVLIPFKPIPIIPGWTEFRPANAIPPVMSFLFGPAAAWGTAFGNVIGDLFGTFGPGSLFGFVGNFLLGLLPYKLWRGFARRDMPFQSAGGRIAGEVIGFAGLMLLSSASCGVIVAWGVQMIGGPPFLALAPIITLNNTIVSILFCPFLLAALGPRVKGWGLTHVEILDLGEKPATRPSLFPFGVLLVALGAFGGLGAGVALSLAHAQQAVDFALIPFVLAILAGAALL